MKRICRVKFTPPPSFSGLIAKMNSRLRLNAQAGRWRHWFYSQVKKHDSRTKKNERVSTLCLCSSMYHMHFYAWKTWKHPYISTNILLFFFYENAQQKKSDTELCGGKPLFRTLGKRSYQRYLQELTLDRMNLDPPLLKMTGTSDAAAIWVLWSGLFISLVGTPDWCHALS